MDFDLGGDWKEEWGEAGLPGASLVQVTPHLQLPRLGDLPVSA